MAPFSPFAQGLAMLGATILAVIGVLILPTPPVVQALAWYLLVLVLIPTYAFSIIIWVLLGRRVEGLRERLGSEESRSR
jgi:hypothetical protein